MTLENCVNRVTTELNPTEIAKHLQAVKYGRVSIVHRECKHATYSRDRTNRERSDMLTVKEWITLSNGIRVPNVRIVKDYKRPYWVTKPQLRNHPEKIEFEDLRNLDMHRSTQINLAQDICFKLGYGNPRNPLRMIARSPYLYGLDPGPEAFIKQAYADRYPGDLVPNDVTVFDVETDVTSDYKKPLLWSRVTDAGVYLYISKEFSKNIPNYEDHVRNEYNNALDDFLKPIREKLTSKATGEPWYIEHVKNLPLHLVTLDDHFEITKACLDDIHASHTDIVTGWNAIYDTQSIIESCIAAGKDPVNVLSDPKVPSDYRMINVREGATSTVSSSGVKNNLEPQERWDTMVTTSTFRITCAMQIHWQLRKALGKESGGYGLDALTKRHLGAGKVQFSREDSIIPTGTFRWHEDMQANFKVEYGVYSIFDSILVKMKEWKDSDLSHQISSLAGSCDYAHFNRQPTVNATDMLFSVLKEQKRVICSTSDNMETELDRSTLGLSDWIVTFPSFNVKPSGIFALKGQRDVRSTIYMYNSDADVETTYPVAEIINNMSRDTTIAEPCRIRGISRMDLRFVAINLTGGPSNALQLLQTTAKVPPLSEWLEEARQELLP